MRQKITCPVSAHLEEIEYTTDPSDGRILEILSCSACPDIGVNCDMLCAKRLNARLASSRKCSRDARTDV